MNEAGDFRVTVLGCCGTFAAPGGACTGYLLRTPGATVWLDCGPGTFGELQRHVSLADLDAVVVTHEHPDHWLEVPLVYSALVYHQPRSPLPIFTTAGTRDLAEALRHDLDNPFDWNVVSGGHTLGIGDQHWTFSQTDHYVETLAVRVDHDGRSMAFTADTGPGWELGELGDGINFALSEASFLKERESEGILHLSARQAAAGAQRAGIERLALTHLVPGSDAEAHLREAGDAFDGELLLAQVGHTYAV